MMQCYHYKITRKKMTCEIHGFSMLRRNSGFWTLRWNTWFFKASLKCVIFKRFAEMRGSSAQPLIYFHKSRCMKRAFPWTCSSESEKRLTTSIQWYRSGRTLSSLGFGRNGSKKWHAGAEVASPPRVPWNRSGRALRPLHFEVNGREKPHASANIAIHCEPKRTLFGNAVFLWILLSAWIRQWESPDYLACCSFLAQCGPTPLVCLVSHTLGWHVVVLEHFGEESVPNILSLRGSAGKNASLATAWNSTFCNASPK